MPENTTYLTSATTTNAGTINQIGIMASYANFCGTPSTEIWIERRNYEGGSLDCASEHLPTTGLPSFTSEEQTAFYSGGQYTMFSNFTGSQCSVGVDELLTIGVSTNSNCGGKGRTQAVYGTGCTGCERDGWFIVSGVGGTDITNYETIGLPSQIYSMTYSTTTGYAIITGRWVATTTPYVSERLSFWQFSNTLGKESYVQLTATTTGVFNFSFPFLDPYSFTATTSTTTAPIYENFTLNVSLDQYDETNYIFPYGGTIITNLDFASSTISAVDSYNASDFTSNPRALALYPEYECSISSITGCFKNALIWALYPTQETLDNWSSLQNKIENKAPFGYFYMTKNNINGLSSTSTKAFNVIIPSSLKNYIFIPLDTGVASILWFFFIFNFYKRLKTITI